MLALLALNALAFDGQCTEPTSTERSVTVDVDGDGKPETIETKRDGGSGMSAELVTVTRGTGETFAFDAGFSFYGYVNVNEVPPELVADPVLRGVVEPLIFGTMCKRLDPATVFAMKKPDTLAWVDGQPFVPGFQTVYAEVDGKPSWVTSASQRWRAGQDFPPAVLDESDDWHLFQTGLGALVIDRKNDRYAWILTPRGDGQGKLRHFSVQEGHLVGDVAKVAWTSMMSTGVVEVDLTTGAIKQTVSAP